MLYLAKSVTYTEDYVYTMKCNWLSYKTATGQECACVLQRSFWR